jgi:dTDP-4-amino-4,6-dideoxy-D-galactose acyltransferase
MIKEENSICRLLDWDTEFFGSKIAQCTPTRLNHKIISEILQWCNNHQIDCLYFLSDSDNNLTIQLLEENGFHFVDIRLTFDKLLGSIEDHVALNSDIIQVRRFTQDDIPTLKNIARGNYRFTRFYYDSHFSKDRCDSMYEIWIEKSCNGMADKVLVAEVNDVICGYITCKVESDSIGKIGLIGVHPDWHGSGIGQHLVEGAINWFFKQEIQNIEVIAQARNIPAQRLYQNCGFKTKSLQLWYHKWFLE